MASAHHASTTSERRRSGLRRQRRPCTRVRSPLLTAARRVGARTSR
jgi:hypothetical protein